MPTPKWAAEAAAGISAHLAEVFQRGAELAALQMTRDLRAERDALRARLDEANAELSALKAKLVLQKISECDLK